MEEINKIECPLINKESNTVTPKTFAIPPDIGAKCDITECGNNLYGICNYKPDEDTPPTKPL